MTTVARSPNMTVHEARQRLQQERNSRLTQLSAIEAGAALAEPPDFWWAGPICSLLTPCKGVKS